MKNVEALKNLYVALGGEAADVANLTTSVEVLNAIAAKYEGASDAILNPEAIENIAAVAENIGGGSGKSGGSSIEGCTFVPVDITINGGANNKYLVFKRVFAGADADNLVFYNEISSKELSSKNYKIFMPCGTETKRGFLTYTTYGPSNATAKGGSSTTASKVTAENSSMFDYTVIAFKTISVDAEKFALTFTFSS